jgi:hypothetical protein
MFLIYKEVQIESVAKSYMRKDLLIYEERRKYLTVTTRNNIRASVVIALYSMSTIRELNSKSGNTFI